MKYIEGETVREEKTPEEICREGIRYYYGDQVKEDKIEAVKWFKNAFLCFIIHANTGVANTSYNIIIFFSRDNFNFPSIW